MILFLYFSIFFEQFGILHFKASQLSIQTQYLILFLLLRLLFR